MLTCIQLCASFTIVYGNSVFYRQLVNDWSLFTARQHT